MGIVISSLPAYLQGTVITIIVTVFALAVGLAVGIPIGLGRVYGPRWLSIVATVYVTVVRSLPEIVALFLFLFVVGAFLPMPPIAAAVLALAVISSAYQAEIFRGAIGAVGRGQLQAARALGMGRFLGIRTVVLPQALRFALPGWSNEAAGMIKASSLVYALGVPELLRQAEYVSARTLEPLIAFATAGVIYLILTIVTVRSLRAFERRIALPA